MASKDMPSIQQVIQRRQMDVWSQDRNRADHQKRLKGLESMKE
jgi:hypothetical protein